MTASASVRISAIDETSSVFAQVGQRIQRWGSEASSASSRFSDGFRRASSSITNLAGDVLAADNRIAGLTEGIATLAFGGAVATGVLAGVAAIAAGLSYFSREATRAQEAYDAYMASLRRQTPFAVVGKQVDELTERLSKPLFQKTLFEALRDVFTGDKMRAQLNEALAQEKLLLDQYREARRQALIKAFELPEITATAKSPALVRAERAQRGVDQADLAIRAAGGPSVIGRADMRIRRSNAEDRVAPGDLPQTGVDPGGISAAAGAFEAVIERFRQFRFEVAVTDEALGKLAGETLVSLADGLAANFAAIGRGRGVFEGLARAALKPITDEARGYGKIAIAKGAVKIKDSLWPPNPLGLASGAGMIAAGGALLAAVGSVTGGGGVGASAGGAGAGYGATTRGEDIRDTGKVTFVVPDDFSMRPTDPRVMEWLSEAFEQATGRRTLFVPASAIAQGR